MVRGIAAAVGCLAATAATAVAFQGTAPPQAAPPVFRGGIDLVPLAASVLDRSGHPVADLKASDFLVLEDGASQPIVTFGAVNLPVPPAVPGSVAGAANAVASDVATNAPHDGRVFLLVLDDMLIPNDPLMERTAKELARRVIDRLAPDDVMSVIFTRDNRHAQDFTTDKARLYAAVEEFSAGTAYISGGPSSYQLGSSISVISRAAEALAAIPQRRKALVYISEGAAVDLDLAVQPTPAGAAHARLIDEMNETFRRAERANVAVYGFVPSPDGTEGPLTRMYLSTGMDAIAAQLAAHKQATLTDDFLLSNASNTNGRAVLHSTDAPAGIDRMFEEMSVYYVLGYRSSNAKPDTYRRVQVKITRPGSYDVRTIGQYYVEKAAKPSATPPSAVATAMSGILPDATIPLRLNAAAFAGKDGKTANVAIVMDVRQSALPDGGTLHVDVEARAFTPEGESRAARAAKVDVRLRPSPAGTTAEYELLSSLTLKPGRYELRAAVHDQAHSAGGSVYADVDVPDFSKEKLSISSVVIFAAPSHVVAPKDALSSWLPIMPTAERAFSPQDQPSAFLRVYQPGKGPAAPASLDVRIVDAHQTVLFERTQAAPADHFIGPARTMDVTLALPLTPLAPGDYVLQIDAKTDRASASRRVPFTRR